MFFCLQIALNGVHFCHFNHRLPLHSARFISIGGDVMIHSITQERDTVPGGAPIPIHRNY